MIKVKALTLPIPKYEDIYEIDTNSIITGVARLDNRGRRVAKRTKSINLNRYGYKIVMLYKDSKYKNYTVHQLLAITFLGHEPSGFNVVVDHIDGNKLNNNLNNLQLISNRENITKDVNNKTGYLGVSENRNKYIATIRIKGEHVSLGTFDTPKLANNAYNKKLKDIEQ